MANQHSKDTRAVTYRLEPELVTAIAETAAQLGEDRKTLVSRALWGEIEKHRGNPEVAEEWLSRHRRPRGRV